MEKYFSYFQFTATPVVPNNACKARRLRSMNPIILQNPDKLSPGSIINSLNKKLLIKKKLEKQI